MTTARTRIKAAGLVAAVLLGTAASGAAAHGDGDHGRAERARLTGFQEVPAVSTDAEGVFRARVDSSRRQIRFVLRYGRLSGVVQQAHIHLGQRSVNGGVAVFLCDNLGGAPAGTQPCPQGGTVRGTLTPDDVIGPVAQGIEAGEFGELVRALRAGKTYANVHTEPFPAGEIRGQINHRRHSPWHH